MKKERDLAGASNSKEEGPRRKDELELASRLGKAEERWAWTWWNAEEEMETERDPAGACSSKEEGPRRDELEQAGQ
ncbi:hypothetical protein GH714_003423 [Hevea brasiliensis]|uniref:Uncharacterized protein n=1 Tax=Hevea brasiliensis TaxID=3981 RepID=A0A6A6KKI7_HEVBR|nr:hypothetical protein GH714_003423 [Hevea brasiliensis]